MCKATESNEIKEAVQRYLENGGEVKVIPFGVKTKATELKKMMQQKQAA